MTTAMRINQWLRKVPVWPGYVLGFIPAAWWLYLGLTGGLGAEPVRALEHELGKFALQLFLASLLITPLLHQTRVSLIRFRRMIGLMAFWYMLLHVTVWVTLDLQFAWGKIGAELVKRPYMVVGALAVLLLIPVAVTSNNAMVRRLKAQSWHRIHMLVYPAAILAGVHYLWAVKSWPAEPVLYLSAAVLLVLYRPFRRLRKARNPNKTRLRTAS
ncbi:protein-methionine-sulfoxide reductase heme-binding subunit MsrQ [Halovulum sp. GXIMD14794]